MVLKLKISKNVVLNFYSPLNFFLVRFWWFLTKKYFWKSNFGTFWQGLAPRIYKNIKWFVFWLSVTLGHPILTAPPCSFLPWITLIAQCSEMVIMIQKFKNGFWLFLRESRLAVRNGKKVPTMELVWNGDIWRCWMVPNWS